MFLLVLAYPGCPGSKAVKRSLLLLLSVQCSNADFCHFSRLENFVSGHYFSPQQHFYSSKQQNCDCLSGVARNLQEEMCYSIVFLMQCADFLISRSRP